MVQPGGPRNTVARKSEVESPNDRKEVAQSGNLNLARGSRGSGNGNVATAHRLECPPTVATIRIPASLTGAATPNLLSARCRACPKRSAGEPFPANKRPQPEAAASTASITCLRIAFASGPSHFASPCRRAISRPCRSRIIVIGMPSTPASVPMRRVGSR